jgi:hypothetical protein
MLADQARSLSERQATSSRHRGVRTEGLTGEGSGLDEKRSFALGCPGGLEDNG